MKVYFQIDKKSSKLRLYIARFVYWFGVKNSFFLLFIIFRFCFDLSTLFSYLVCWESSYLFHSLRIIMKIRKNSMFVTKHTHMWRHLWSKFELITFIWFNKTFLRWLRFNSARFLCDNNSNLYWILKCFIEFWQSV